MGSRWHLKSGASTSAFGFAGGLWRAIINKTLGRFGIRVNALVPGFTGTTLSDLAPANTPRLENPITNKPKLERIVGKAKVFDGDTRVARSCDS